MLYLRTQKFSPVGCAAKTKEIRASIQIPIAHADMNIDRFVLEYITPIQ